MQRTCEQILGLPMPQHTKEAVHELAQETDREASQHSLSSHVVCKVRWHLLATALPIHACLRVQTCTDMGRDVFFFLCDSYSGGRRRAGCGLPALLGATVQSMPQDGTVEQTMVAQRPQNLEDVEEAVQGTPQERVHNRKVKQTFPCRLVRNRLNKQQQQRQQYNLERLLFWTPASCRSRSSRHFYVCKREDREAHLSVHHLALFFKPRRWMFLCSFHGPCLWHPLF